MRAHRLVSGSAPCIAGDRQNHNSDPVSRVRRRPSYTADLHRPDCNTAAVTARIAYEILSVYGARVPRWQDLQDRFGMSRPTAYRWVRAIKEVRGVA